MRMKIARTLSILALAGTCYAAQISPWPPKVGEPYPDLELIDQTGMPVRLSSFKGKVLLIEPVGMNCPACQAFAGAHKIGAFQGITPQRGLPSIEEALPKYAGGITLSDPRIVYVQLLLFNMSLMPTTPEDAKAWAQHFKRDRSKNQIVLAGGPEFLKAERRQASYNLIPGFHLVDKDFILRSNATGHQPQHDLWRQLFPMVPALVAESKP